MKEDNTGLVLEHQSARLTLDPRSSLRVTRRRTFVRLYQDLENTLVEYSA